MRHFKKWIALAVCLCLGGSILCSCEKQENEQVETLNLYASFYPIYALTAMITQNVPDVYLSCLVQPQDGCLRAYSLSDWDFALLNRSADAIILGGEGLESFETLLYLLGEEGPAVSTVLNGIELTTQQGANTQEDAETHWLDPNPHIYMKIDGAQEILKHISASLSIMDPKYETLYAENLELAQSELKALQEEIHQTVGDRSDIKVAVMNEALVYTAQEYALDVALYYDRDSGESLSGTGLEQCLSALEESGAKVILIEKQAPQSLLNALKAAGYAVAPMDILSTRTANEGYNGLFEAYRANAEALNKAFGEVNAHNVR